MAQPPDSPRPPRSTVTRRARAPDDEGASLAGLGCTAWPSLSASPSAWLAPRAWRDPLPPLRTGVPLALITVAAGTPARWATDEGTALPFVIVATVFRAPSSDGAPRERVHEPPPGRARYRDA